MIFKCFAMVCLSMAFFFLALCVTQCFQITILNYVFSSCAGNSIDANSFIHSHIIKFRLVKTYFIHFYVSSIFCCWIFIQKKKIIILPFLNAKPELLHFDNAIAFFMLCRRSFCHIKHKHYVLCSISGHITDSNEFKYGCHDSIDVFYVQCMKYMSFTQLAN